MPELPDAEVSATSRPVTLRPFVEADDDEVTSWFADAGELRFFAGRRLSWPLDSGQWRSIRLDPSVTAWTAVIGDDPTPVGHAEFVSVSAEVVRLARYAVSPALRGQGLGRSILNRLMEMAREDGFGTMTLAVHPQNTTAILAYRTFGFETQADGAADAGLPDVTNSAERVIMSLKLT
jgi:GNAT superfamily N-acetyltransferase